MSEKAVSSTLPSASRRARWTLAILAGLVTLAALAGLLFVRHPIAVFETDLRPYVLDGRLSEVRVPVVLLWGDSDRLLPVAYAETPKAGLPQARLVLVPRCGHVSHRECPEKFVAALEKALAD